MNNSLKKSLYVMLFAIVFVPLYVKFYTGNNIIVTFVSFLSGTSNGMDSNYSLYQSYFEANNLGQFSFAKLPYILAMGGLKWAYWSNTIYVIGYKKRLIFKDLLPIFFTTFLFFLLGVARGTSFENFEIFVLFIYSIILRERIVKGQLSISRDTLIKMFYLSLGVGAYFIYSKALRFSDKVVIPRNITKELGYSTESYINEFLPSLGRTLYNFVGYFGFGLYFTGEAIVEFFAKDALTFILSFIPKGGVIYNNTNSLQSFMCGKVIDCGAAWIPDNILILSNVGIILFVVLIVKLGRLSSILFRKLINNSVSSAVLFFFILLFFVSLPVGNFISSSSATILALLISILSYLRKT